MTVQELVHEAFAEGMKSSKLLWREALAAGFITGLVVGVLAAMLFVELTAALR